MDRIRKGLFESAASEAYWQFCWQLVFLERGRSRLDPIAKEIDPKAVFILTGDLARHLVRVRSPIAYLSCLMQNLQVIDRRF
jgi:hypothetical protein